VTTYHLASIAAGGRMTVYATTHTEAMAERMLAALHAAGHTDVEIVPVGREATFAERYPAAAA
jgi:hypothetical protein